VERLRELKRRMDQLKDSPEPLVAYGILSAIGASPPQVEEIVVDIFGTKATAVMTNVPGPREQLFLAGSPVKKLMFWVPQSGRLGLGVSIFSYNGQVMLGVATDVGLVPDPGAIIDAFHQELIDMRLHIQEVIQETALALDLPLQRADPGADSPPTAEPAEETTANETQKIAVSMGRGEGDAEAAGDAGDLVSRAISDSSDMGRQGDDISATDDGTDMGTDDEAGDVKRAQE
jgi:hypothetical protein